MHFFPGYIFQDIISSNISIIIITWLATYYLIALTFRSCLSTTVMDEPCICKIHAIAITAHSHADNDSKLGFCFQLIWILEKKNLLDVAESRALF